MTPGRHTSLSRRTAEARRLISPIELGKNTSVADFAAVMAALAEARHHAPVASPRPTRGSRSTR